MSIRAWSVWLLSFVCSMLLIGASVVLIARFMDGIGSDSIGYFLWVPMLNPILWGLMMFYVDWDEQPWRPALLMALVSALCLLVIGFVDTGI